MAPSAASRHPAARRRLVAVAHARGGGRGGGGGGAHPRGGRSVARAGGPLAAVAARSRAARRGGPSVPAAAHGATQRAGGRRAPPLGRRGGRGRDNPTEGGGLPAAVPAAVLAAGPAAGGVGAGARGRVAERSAGRRDPRAQGTLLNPQPPPGALRVTVGVAVAGWGGAPAVEPFPRLAALAALAVMEACGRGWRGAADATASTARGRGGGRHRRCSGLAPHSQRARA